LNVLSKQGVASASGVQGTYSYEHYNVRQYCWFKRINYHKERKENHLSLFTASIIKLIISGGTILGVM